MNKKPTPPDSESVNLKVSTALYRALKAISVKQDRSLSYVAKAILTVGVQKKSEKL
jgi:hypothetical protein